MAVMDTLDTSINLYFNPSSSIATPVVCGCKCLYAYSATTEFKTVIDEHFSGNEQRRDQWTTPRRSWVLEFAKTPDNFRQIDAFFVRQKGRKRAFRWTWFRTVDGMDTGGDGNTYTVRFDTDKLDYQMLEMGYATFKVPIVQVNTNS